MEHASIGDAAVPAVGLGTWRLSGDRCRRAVAEALELGYRHLDTAQKYDNERAVGLGLEESDVPREEVFLTTKVWVRNARYRDVLESTHRSLERLGTDYVDLLVLHWPHPWVPIEETMRAMEELREQGYIRHAGVSNFGRDRLDKARAVSEVPIVANQVQLNPVRPQRALREYCTEEDVLLIGYSPLAHGGLVHDRRLRRIAERYGKSPAQIAIRWCIQHEGVATIPKATGRTHLRENLDVFDVELTPEECEWIERPSWLRMGLAWGRGWLGL